MPSLHIDRKKWSRAPRAARSTCRNAFILALSAAAIPSPSAADPALEGLDLFGATRSTTIALTKIPLLRKLVSVNLEANSVTVFKVGSGSLEKQAEIPVGREPRCVAVDPLGIKAFVTNSGSGTVSVVSLLGLKANTVVATIPVGTEPRACALTPNGALLLVANFTEGTLSAIDTKTYAVVGTIPIGGNPGALAISGDRVFVTQFFARTIAGGPGEGFDNGREGVVKTFLLGAPGQIDEITLSPLADSGFTADRTSFCTALNPNAVNDTFCPDTAITDPTDPKITQNPQAVFPNQFFSALVCGKALYLPSIGAQPSPPVAFNTNVQALVHVVDANALAERADLHVNLNAQIKTEPVPASQVGTLQRAFGNDIVAIDADKECKNFFIVSRGGNYVLKATPGADGKLNIGAPDNVVRLQTGNIPDGIVVDGGYAYVNNEVDLSVSVIDLAANTRQDVPASTPPEPGSFEHARLMGKLVFHTALGVPDDGLVGTQLRDINPVNFRGKQSADAWSSCASCHPLDGLADSVTWVFGDGPRQSIPLDGLFSKVDPLEDTRINNWSGVRDSVTDFNNNSRGVQCGAGFAGGVPLATVPGVPSLACPQVTAFGPGPNPAVFDHGIQQGASEALDFETTWTETVRALNEPKGDTAAISAGATLFEGTCASCHGGAKWTKSQVIYLSNPALDKAFAAGGTPRDPGLTMIANQSVSYADAKVDPGVLKFLEDVGTFNPANPIEIGGAAANIGKVALGVLGFNEPSLLGVGSSAPYFHNGQAQTLDDVFAQHKLPDGNTIQASFGAGDLANLSTFLKSIDGATPIFRSQTDDFKDPFVVMTGP
jgi:YVTN family beta-propeller protein